MLVLIYQMYFDIEMRHTLLFGKPLRAFSTKQNIERVLWLRLNSGMVIMKRIGQSACLLPKNDNASSW